MLQELFHRFFEFLKSHKEPISIGAATGGGVGIGAATAIGFTNEIFTLGANNLTARSAVIGAASGILFGAAAAAAGCAMYDVVKIKEEETKEPRRINGPS